MTNNVLVFRCLRISNGIKFLLLLITLSSSLTVSCQSWNWRPDGYNSGSGGGTYLNVDGQGTNMVITGLVNDRAVGSAGNECVHVGIDNQLPEGLQHHYKFEFSNPVSVNFKIIKINKGSPCYTDYLSFSGTPKLVNPLYVKISGNNVIPEHSSPIEGEVTVKYNLTTGFTITHGDGVRCNPGHIHICALNFDPTTTSANEFLPEARVQVFPNPAQKQFNLINNYASVLKIKIVNDIGQLFHEAEISPRSMIKIDISEYPEGLFIIQLQRNEGFIGYRKLVVQR